MDSELQLQKLVLVNVWGIEAYPAVLARFLSSFKSIGYLNVFVDRYITENEFDDSDVPGLEGDIPLPEGTLLGQTISLNAPNAAIFRSLEQCYRPQDLTRLDVHSTALRELCLDLPLDSWDVDRWLYPLRGRRPLPPFKLPVTHTFASSTSMASNHESLEKTVWPELICMLASASSTLRVVCLHAEPVNPDLSVLNHSPQEFDNCNWAALGKKLATFRPLWRIYVVLDAHVGEAPAALASAPAWTEATERLESAMPSEVRAKLVFGAWRKDRLFGAK
ncbi:hypothetical protein PHLGIDRAFT_123261 [Phlebiopsis gigantea 11061_1 CR5-6]|uniref:Uncharacterized protein n=1 Tax=Phlebiopsis gigantea (strain 11061_1 CR5-6) TaxID=745531 RepID=A0A0C3P9X1_PHLG1|nr:hypothetical protein PHLGIDRAFT_123261 [Phlebiopsis gigantea 11061_1 CR5-6]